MLPLVFLPFFSVLAFSLSRPRRTPRSTLCFVNLFKVSSLTCNSAHPAPSRVVGGMTNFSVALSFGVAPVSKLKAYALVSPWRVGIRDSEKVFVSVFPLAVILSFHVTGCL